MRKLLIAALAGAVALVFAAVALAKTESTFTQKFTVKKTATSTGTQTKITLSDPDNKVAGQEGKPTYGTDQVIVNFPKGSKFDTTTVPQCSVQLASQDRCPKGSQVGTGVAEVDARGLDSFGDQKTPLQIKAFNTNKGIIFALQKNPNSPIPPTTLVGQLSGVKLTTKIPPAVNTLKLYLTQFSLKTNAIKKGKKIYFKTPAKCPKGGWKVSTKFIYEAKGNAAPTTINQKIACMTPKKKK